MKDTLIKPARLLAFSLAIAATAAFAQSAGAKKPVVISTWHLGLAANEAAWPVLKSGGRALDAVETGARVPEADPHVGTVGLGGAPDAEGHVTLDACIMDEHGNAGSVAFLENILHPVSVARKVMEETPHVMLVGIGAEEFAYAHGFEKTNLLTPAARERWEKWLKENRKPAIPKINVENHDTIGILALDEAGNLSGACTTSGAGFKMRGRVGDSPLIGDGLFVDNDVGAAAATGWGEAVIRNCGSFLVVEFMRQGHSPTDACRLAIERLIAHDPEKRKYQVGFIALNKKGEFGGYSIEPGFAYSVCDADGGNRMIKTESARARNETH